MINKKDTYILGISTFYPASAACLMKNRGIFKEFWGFLKVRQRFCLAPTIFILVLLSFVIAFTQNSVVAPFIYTLF